MRPPRNRYAQVALTYATPWPMRVWAISFAAFAAWLLALREANYVVRLSVLLLGGTLAAWVGAMVPSHAKEQLADARARLTPRYRPPHLLVAAVAFLLSAIGVAAFTVLRLGALPGVLGWPSVTVSSVGFMADVLAASAALAWMAHTQSPKFIFAVILSFGLFVFPLHRPTLARLTVGDFPRAAWVVIGLSLAAIGALWWRLGVMHEEMAEYWRVENYNTRLRVQMTGDRYYRRSTAAEAGDSNAWVRASYRLDRVDNVFAAPLWTRVAHWRMMSGLGWVHVINAVAFFGVVLTTWLYDPARPRPAQEGILIALPVVIGALVPILIVGTSWPRRWYTLAQESLRPATRRRFLTEQGAAMAAELLASWAWMTAGGLAPGLLFRPSWVLSPRVAADLLLTGALQVWLFAVAMWLLRYRSAIVWSVVTAMLADAGAFAVLAWQLGDPDRSGGMRTPSVPVAAAIAAVGLVIAADAQRRWLNTDLD